MNSFFTTTQILLFVGAAQGLVLSFILYKIRRSKSNANKFLAVILAVFSFNIILHAVSHGSRIIGIPHHEIVIQFTLLLFGPLLYFYVVSLTTGLSVPAKKYLIHFVPFISCLLISVPFYITSINLTKPHIILSILSALIFIHVIIYLVVTTKSLLIHSQRIKDSYSSLEKINLRWLRLLITGFTFSLLFGFCLDLFNIQIIGWDIVWLIISLLMYIIGYMGLGQPEIFSPFELVLLKDKSEAKKKYEKSTLTSDTADAYLQKLISYMKSERPYLNNNITLPELAGKISIPVHHLSQIINERLNRNFFEFVNSYRVEEAKKMLIDPAYRNFNILAIGLNAGFNSVSAFNAAFKKIVLKTPSEYRKSFLHKSISE